MKYIQKRDIENIEKLNNELLPLLPDFCNSFFIGIEQKTSPLTRLNYARDLIVFFSFLTNEIALFKNKKAYEFEKDDLNKITIDDLEIYMSKLSHYISNGKDRINGEQGKMRKMSTLRSFFKYFYVRGDINENILTKIDLPKIHEKPITRLTKEEVESMITSASINPRDEMILTLFLLSGIRVSELVGLDYGDIDLDNKTFLVTRKGGAKTILHMGAQLHSKFMEYLHGKEMAKDTPLFTKCDHRLTVRSIQNIVKKYAKEAAPLKKISPHKLRSTYGTNLYRATGDIYVVADILGHKDINTTKKHYAAISEDIRKDAADRVKI